MDVASYETGKICR